MLFVQTAALHQGTCAHTRAKRHKHVQSQITLCLRAKVPGAISAEGEGGSGAIAPLLASNDWWLDHRQRRVRKRCPVVGTNRRLLKAKRLDLRRRRIRSSKSTTRPTFGNLAMCWGIPSSIWPDRDCSPLTILGGTPVLEALIWFESTPTN